MRAPGTSRTTPGAVISSTESEGSPGTNRSIASTAADVAMLAAPRPRSLARRRNPVRPSAGGSGRVHGTTALLGSARPSSGVGGRWSMVSFLRLVGRSRSTRGPSGGHADQLTDAAVVHGFGDGRR